MDKKNIILLGIESSCDDTSAAIIQDSVLLSQVTANQKVHKKFGGVVPELASRAHQANIIPVVDLAVKEAGIKKNQISAVAFTRGPGLLGSLLVGTSFAKGFALAQNIPLIEVNHLRGHIAALFLREKGDNRPLPDYPFLTLLVSGGHTQIVVVRGLFDMEIIGETIDDAAGEAFDKCSKVLGLGYPGGPIVDKYSKLGNSQAYKFTRPKVQGLNFSFSGLKTAFLYFIRDEIKKDEHFVKDNLYDICASIQFTIVDILIERLKEAAIQTGIKEVALAGGVSANSELRERLTETGKHNGWKVHIPPFKYTTDNAAMIALTGYHKFLTHDFAGHDTVATARFEQKL
ncbi:MAG: tRNA (adenosine(37)-N6)-threonylcarbamoyltransferase complex transferase subunit TsaD [Bacteroidota bacterium]|nr:tRNA (adenosine(37)-N6)-threonylcarbamoyltransferase complex transferase subunit TsaD [Bacteroidota bacterium]